MITSPDRGPLVISSGRGTCWYTDENDVGQRQVEASVQMSGDVGCQAFAQLAVSLMNDFLVQLGTTGLELPAGAQDVDETQTTTGVFEPTGKTTTDTSHIIFLMVSPKRTPPSDPYS